MDLIEVGKKIRERRTELGISQQELANAVGYSGKDMISRVESGKINIPMDKLMAICRVLRLNVSDFLDTYPEKGRDYVITDKRMMIILENIQGLSAENLQKLSEYIQILKESELWHKQNGTANGGGYESQKTEKQNPSPLPEEADQEEKMLMQRLKDSYDSLNSAASERRG